jgi:plastocyanin domain-containing protein
VIELRVTKDGFVPAEIRVQKGERVRLAVTRQVERTCATELVVKDYGINAPLPLGKTVYVELTPKKTGAIRYACGMDMVSGVLLVE